MPELPDLNLYVDVLNEQLRDDTLLGIRVANLFVLRTAEPPIESLVGKKVRGISRLGKRLIFTLEGDFYIVVHLMIAGRFKWYRAGAKIPGKLGLLALDFSTGTLVLTEASQKHRASVHLVAGKSGLTEFDKGGLEVFNISLERFKEILSLENHTLKRSLTDQRFLAGIGNAYSDEILHHARISPMRQIRHLTDEQWQALYDSCRIVLQKWCEILKTKAAGKFPTKVTAFHDEMAVHGKYRQPCPDCGNPVQRIRYATNECNYCAHCQNQGNLLADRGLSRLLKKDWPKTLEELDH